jgi:hypothetical protein
MTWKFIGMQNGPNNLTRRVAKTSVPLTQTCSETQKSLFDRSNISRLERV